MADGQKKYTHVGVEIKTQKQIAILSKVHGCNIYDLVANWTEASWNQAKVAGLVTDAMLAPQQAHVVGHPTVVDLDRQDGKKLLKALKLQPVKNSKKAASRRGMIKA
jgi:hypothetical protein